MRYSVTDDGLGIDAEQQSRLFQERTRTDANGVVHGLGLWIVRRIVEQLNGRIGVDSVMGQGSTFWFELPVAGNDLSTSPPGVTQRPVGRQWLGAGLPQE